MITSPSAARLALASDAATHKAAEPRKHIPVPSRALYKAGNGQGES